MGVRRMDDGPGAAGRERGGGIQAPRTKEPLQRPGGPEQGACRPPRQTGDHRQRHAPSGLPYYSDVSLELAEQLNISLGGDVSPEEAVATLQKDLQKIIDRGEQAAG